MREKELIALIIATLDAAFVDQGFPFEVAQAFQPTTQGRQSGPVAWLQTLFGQPIGFPSRTTLEDPDDAGQTIQRTAQRYNTSFQITGTSPQVPGAEYTALDVAQLTRNVVLSPAFMEPLSAQGVGLEQPSQISVTHFVNGREENEAAPSFSFALTHEQITLTKTPAAVSTGYRQYPV